MAGLLLLHCPISLICNVIFTQLTSGFLDLPVQSRLARVRDSLNVTCNRFFFSQSRIWEGGKKILLTFSGHELNVASENMSGVGLQKVGQGKNI